MSSSSPGFGATALRASIVDVVVVSTVAVTSLLLLRHGELEFPSLLFDGVEPAAALLSLASSLPLLAWRWSPRLTVAAVGIANVALAVRGELVWPPVSMAAAVFLHAVSRSDEPQRGRRDVALALGLVIAYLGVGVAAAGFGQALHTAIPLAAAWFAGERVRLRRAQLRDLRERAESLRRESVRERELAVAEERSRIARDLHDSTAHALSVITVRAGAARMRGDAERSQAALADIEELARGTMGDIDRMVGALRDPRRTDHSVEPPPGLAALDALVAQHRSGGHLVELVSQGDPRDLPSPVDHGVYRILQEALTNAARYGDKVTGVTLTYEPDALRLTVTNGRSAPVRPRPDGGHGLAGMRERAQLLGGSLTTDKADGRFQVRCRLPYTGRAR